MGGVDLRAVTRHPTNAARAHLIAASSSAPLTSRVISSIDHHHPRHFGFNVLIFCRMRRNVLSSSSYRDAIDALGAPVAAPGGMCHP